MEPTATELKTLKGTSQGHEANQELDALLPDWLKQVQRSLKELES